MFSWVFVEPTLTHELLCERLESGFAAIDEAEGMAEIDKALKQDRSQQKKKSKSRWLTIPVKCGCRIKKLNQWHNITKCTVQQTV